jgi:hypothetical protein
MDSTTCSLRAEVPITDHLRDYAPKLKDYKGGDRDLEIMRVANFFGKFLPLIDNVNFLSQ